MINRNNSGFNKVGIFNYSFSLDHDTMLIDRKNFVKTIHQGIKNNECPKPYIEIFVGTSIGKIVFYFSHTVDGKFFYKEDTYVDKQ